MYVATRELKVVDRQDKVTIYHAGDVIPDFDKWDIHAYRAHINMEWVKIVEPLPVGEPQLAASSHQCDVCKREFKSEKALKTHNTLAHK